MTELEQISTENQLEDASDDELESLIKQARALLDERDANRKREALLRIRDIAKQHGLIVDVHEKKRKRRSAISASTNAKAA